MSFFISRTPFRISFFGGGTDFPEWYSIHGGSVISTTIDKYCYISARYLPPFFESRHRIVWSHIELVNSIGEILHPAVREGLRSQGFEDERGIEIHHQADLPARSGTGSSSSFAVGLIKVLKAIRGQEIAGLDLARAAIDLERNRLRETVGTQDQIAAAVGGFNQIQFHRSGELEAAPMRVPPARLKELQDSLYLLFTGAQRVGTRIAEQMVRGLDDHAAQLKAMRLLVDRGSAIIENTGPLEDFGLLLDETWKLKRSLDDQISNARIDGIYGRAIEAGALGGKLLGAGGSGFMLFYVPPDRKARLRSALHEFLEVPFGFEYTGSSIIHQPAGRGAGATR